MDIYLVCYTYACMRLSLQAALAEEYKSPRAHVKLGHPNLDPNPSWLPA